MAETRRMKLQNEFIRLLGSGNVYFQPPESLKMKYPCIRYELDTGKAMYANDKVYGFRRRYSVVVIDRDPEVEWDKILINNFEYCEFERAYAADNLNHWRFTLYW